MGWLIGMLILGAVLLWPLLKINKDFEEMEEHEEIMKHFKDEK